MGFDVKRGPLDESPVPEFLFEKPVKDDDVYVVSGRGFPYDERRQEVREELAERLVLRREH